MGDDDQFSSRGDYGNVVVLFGFQTPEEHAQRAGMLSYLLRGLGQQPSRLRVASFGNTSRSGTGISRLVHAWASARDSWRPRPRIGKSRASHLTPPRGPAPRPRRRRAASSASRTSSFGVARLGQLFLAFARASASSPSSKCRTAVDDHASVGVVPGPGARQPAARPPRRASGMGAEISRSCSRLRTAVLESRSDRPPSRSPPGTSVP